MPRPRKPTKILQFTGAFNKNPARAAARGAEVKPKAGIGDPPEDFDEVHAALWHEVLGEALPGVLGNSDRKILEVTVRCLKKLRDDYDPKLAAQLNLFLQQLGMTPAARSKVAAPNDKKEETDSLAAI